jgi:hypothetical protein
MKISDKDWKALRETIVRNESTFEREGPVRPWALRAAGKRTPEKMLVDVALNGPQSEDEHVFVSKLLLSVSRGEDVRTAFRSLVTKKTGHRDKAADTAMIVLEIAVRLAEGDTMTEARAAVAEMTGKEPETVRAIWRRATADKR